MTIEHADLTCERCDLVTEHELHYAGRLLESVRCTRCGHQFAMTQRALVPAYLHDLEQRVVSKPQRLYHRATRDPRGFLLHLPPGQCCGSPRSSCVSSGRSYADPEDSAHPARRLLHALEEHHALLVVDPPGRRRGSDELDGTTSAQPAHHRGEGQRWMRLADADRGRDDERSDDDPEAVAVQGAADPSVDGRLHRVGHGTEGGASHSVRRAHLPEERLRDERAQRVVQHVGAVTPGTSITPEGPPVRPRPGPGRA